MDYRRVSWPDGDFLQVGYCLLCGFSLTHQGQVQAVGQILLLGRLVNVATELMFRHLIR